MNRRRYIRWGVLLLLIAIILGVIKSAGIHIGNQEFAVNRTEFDSAPVSEIMVTAASGLAPISLEGRVTAINGDVVAGAMITASGPSGNYRLTVFSDEAGGYLLRAKLPDEIEVRARSAHFQDSFKTISLGPDRSANLDFQCECRPNYW